MSTKSQNPVLKRNKKLDKIYNPDSGLVFNSSSKDKLVIGRIEDDEFISLDEKALELCEEYNFKYDESLVETEEEKEVVPEKEDDEEEEEKEEKEEVVPHKKEIKVDVVPVKTKVDTQSPNEVTNNSNFASLLVQLQEYVSNKDKCLSDLEDKLELMRKELSQTKEDLSTKEKELIDTKKKLKGVLSAMAVMQNDL
jgi:hypothetical protein